jgi:16S rRNA (guanine(966)-N(2))-methyltransferase RsmD
MTKKLSRAPRQVRIIGGQWKRTPLPVPELEGLRPTPDRVRETVFNWIEHLKAGDWKRITSLDLFAGTGALGFEAASRGAAKVVLVESHPAALSQLMATKEKLRAEQVSVLRGDALRQMASMAGKFDLIFLDPPYQLQLLPQLLPLCRPLLAQDGLVYAEADAPFDVAPHPEWLTGWQVVRSSKAGAVHYGLLTLNDF